MDESDLRLSLSEVKRVVVKCGTRLLTDKHGKPDTNRISDLVSQIAELHKNGVEVILVSSGAVGMGIEKLGLSTRPTDLPAIQMAAAVGQVRLIAKYENLFSDRSIVTGQVLLIKEDLDNSARAKNAHNTLSSMLKARVVPIVNENDVVSVAELKFGDNDLLAAMTANLMQADALVLLTTVDGVKSGLGSSAAKRISYAEKVNASLLDEAKGKTDALSMGGMESKLKSAEIAAKTGMLVVIADGRKKNILNDIIDGKDTGTLIGSK